jgi:hypothetical protein
MHGAGGDRRRRHTDDGPRGWRSPRPVSAPPAVSLAPASGAHCRAGAQSLALEHARESLEPGAAEPAGELLHPVPGEEASEGEAKGGATEVVHHPRPPRSVCSLWPSHSGMPSSGARSPGVYAAPPPSMGGSLRT